MLKDIPHSCRCTISFSIWQSWEFHPLMPNYFGKQNFFTHSWSYTQRYLIRIIITVLVKFGTYLYSQQYIIVFLASKLLLRLDQTWGPYLFNDSSILVQAGKGKLVSKKVFFKIKIITVKEGGKAFISRTEEISRTALLMDYDMD